MSEQAKARHDRYRGWYVDVTYQGDRHYLTYYMGQISFKDNQSLAVRSAGVINSEIDKGIFRPERWKRRAQKLFTVAGYSNTWLKNIKPSISTATHYDYFNSFKNHIIPVLGEEYIEDVNLDKLTYLMNHINRAPKGKKNVMGAMQRMMKDAHRSGHIPQMPIFPEFRGTNQVIRPELKWIEPNEQFKILEKINKKHRPIFTFIMLTGCRPSEARAFRKQDIKRGYINFAVTFGRSGELKEVKGKKVMPFPLTDALKELFDTIPQYFGQWVFVNPETGNPYSRNINKIFNRAAQKADINISLNNFGRHSFAMQTLKAMDKGMVSHLLRHQDPRMVDHYAEYQTAPLKSMLDKVQTFNSQSTHKKEVHSDDK